MRGVQKGKELQVLFNWWTVSELALLSHLHLLDGRSKRQGIFVVISLEIAILITSYFVEVALEFISYNWHCIALIKLILSKVNFFFFFKWVTGHLFGHMERTSWLLCQEILPLYLVACIKWTELKFSYQLLSNCFVIIILSTANSDQRNSSNHPWHGSLKMDLNLKKELLPNSPTSYSKMTFVIFPYLWETTFEVWDAFVENGSSQTTRIFD